MIQQSIKEWIKYPDMLDGRTLYELRTLLARYPYFQTARLLYLKNLYLLHDISFGEELRKSALYISDRRILFSLVEKENYTLDVFDEKEKSADVSGLDRTLSLIDAFLSSSDASPTVGQSIPLEAASDYTPYLMESVSEDVLKGQDALPMKGQQLIDDFLEGSEERPLMATSVLDDEESEVSGDLAENEDEEDYFTETLAKIYVKQQRYTKALEIIRRLNLKYPKKNAYFADQIRFLEKLIINAKIK